MNTPHRNPFRLPPLLPERKRMHTVTAPWLAAALLLIAAPTLATYDEATRQAHEIAQRAYDRGDYPTVLRISRALAERGDAQAQHNLGVLYDNGEGVAEDDQQAAYWFGKAAEQDHAPAQHNLGTLYHTGEGVPQDDRWAAYWFGKAAELGLAPAQHKLGYLYYIGKGVPEDPVQAYGWIDLAATGGYDPAKRMRAVLKVLMNPAHVAQGQALGRALAAGIGTRDWTANAPP